MPAYEAFETHKMAFYRLARFYTTFFGTAMIPLAAVYTGRLFENASKRNRIAAKIMAAFLTSFSCQFVQHSAYATPDIVLAFFVLLFSFLMLEYLQKENEKYALLSAVIIGIGITIKYTAAILCLPLALSVIYIHLSDKKPLKILNTGILSILIILSTVFFIAPNLFTEYQRTYETLIFEARPTHLGADGLGFWGNLKFYFDQLLQDQGILSLLFVLAAGINMFFRKGKQWLSLLVGPIYWICISVLSLHWIRWGIPIYSFYIIASSIGVGSILEFFGHLKDKNYCASKAVTVGKSVLFCCTGLWMTCLILSAVCFTVYRTLPDVRNVALPYVNENGITANETLSCLRRFKKEHRPLLAGNWTAVQGKLNRQKREI